jgi:dimethylaniline monooxygenase (N-oxide forming)
MNGYIEKHDLSQYFHNSCEVTHLEKFDEDYKVTWIHNGQTHDKVFKYVLISSGRYSKVNYPFPNPEIFSGQIVHGGNYRNASIFKDKKVVAIGLSMTASELAYDAVPLAQSVIQVFRRPYICMKRYMLGAPFDMILFRTSIINHPGSVITDLENNNSFNQAFCQMVGKPETFHPLWKIDESIMGKELLCSKAADDEYYNAVTEGKIIQHKGEVVGVYEHGVILADGSQLEADIIAVGAGFQPDYSYLSDEIKATIQYDSKEKLLSTIMCRSIFHPDLPRLCCVGNFASAAPGHLELQAEIGVKYIIGTLEISNEEMWAGVREEEFARKNVKGPMSPYDFKNYLLDNIRMLKIDINIERIENELGLNDPPFVPYLYYMDRPGQMEICRAWAEDLKKKYPMFRKDN